MRNELNLIKSKISQESNINVSRLEQALYKMERENRSLIELVESLKERVSISAEETNTYEERSFERSRSVDDHEIAPESYREDNVYSIRSKKKLELSSFDENEETVESESFQEDDFFDAFKKMIG